MKRNVWRTLGAGLLELMLLLPIWLVVNILFVPEAYQWIWLAAVLLLQWLAMAAGAVLRVAWQRWLLAIAVGAAAGYAAMSLDPLFALGMTAVSVSVLMLGMTIRSRQANVMITFGVILYFIAAVVFPLVEELQGLAGALSISGTICLITVLFVLNRRFLRTASLASKRPASVPAPLRSHNTVFMIIVTGIVLFVTLVFGKSMGSALFQAIRWILLKLLSGGSTEELPPPEPPPEPSAPPMLPPPGEKGPLGYILDIIGIAFLAAVALAILYGIGYWLYKHSGGVLKQWIHRIAAWLTRRSEEEEAGYTDEEKSVFSWDEVSLGMKDSWLGRLFSRSRGERWEDAQANADRVRFLYRQWLRTAADQGYEAKLALTPKETEADIRRSLPEQADAAKTNQLLQLYYRVRYAREEVSTDEVERVKREMEERR